MNALRLTLAIPLLFLALQASATGFDTDYFSIVAPVDFQGPVTQPMGDKGSVIAFVKPHPATQTNTLLQITVYDAGANAQLPKKEQLGPLSEKYLGQFMEGVKARRTNFTATAPTRVTLGGLPASRTTWSGSAQGQQLHGIMYCVIVGTRIISLHTQDFDTSPAGDISAAEAAIKAIRFKNGG